MIKLFSYVWFWFIVFIILIAVSFSIGFSYGASKSLEWCVDIGSHFLKQQNISIDTEMILNGISNYQSQINNCFYKPKLPGYPNLSK